MNDRDEPPSSEPRIPLEYARPIPRAKPWSRRLFILALALCGLLFATTVLLQPVGRPRVQANRVICASNMRQIGQGCWIYANEHQGKLPDDLGTVLLNEDLTANVFVCPSTSDTPAAGPTTQAVVTNMLLPGHHSYIYLGKGLTVKTATPDVVILYEPLANHANAGMNVLFGDGHAEWLTAAEAQPFLKQVVTGTWPVRLPPAPASRPST